MPSRALGEARTAEDTGDTRRSLSRLASCHLVPMLAQALHLHTRSPVWPLGSKRACGRRDRTSGPFTSTWTSCPNSVGFAPLRASAAPPECAGASMRAHWAHRPKYVSQEPLKNAGRSSRLIFWCTLRGNAGEYGPSGAAHPEQRPQPPEDCRVADVLSLHTGREAVQSASSWMSSRTEACSAGMT